MRIKLKGNLRIKILINNIFSSELINLSNVYFKLNKKVTNNTIDATKILTPEDIKCLRNLI